MKKHVVLLITLAALHFISTSFHAYGQASPVTCVVISNPPETQVVSDYAVTVSPSYVKVMPGSTTTFEITVSSESKISDVISLGIVGLPDGINAVFDPARGTPNFTSKLTVSVDEMICPGTYRPAIIAQNTGMELVDFKLEVDNAASVRKAMETQIADLHSRIDELERAIREDKEANTGYITITLTAMIGSFLLAAFALYVLYRQQKKSDSDFRVQELLDRLRQLIEISKQAKFPFISSNILDEDTEKPLFQPYIFKEIDGIRIGILALISEHLFLNPNDPRKKGLKIGS
ncbi:MAG: hypothetical protein QXP61_08095, partial [Nitrososphaerales archaeon]